MLPPLALAVGALLCLAGAQLPKARAEAEADRIVRAFVRRIGFGTPTKLVGRTREKTPNGIGFWTIDYMFSGREGGSSCLYDDEADVGSFMNYREESRESGTAQPRGRGFANEEDAKAALIRVWSRLGHKYDYNFENFKYSPEVFTRPSRFGNLSGSFTLRIAKHEFVDRHVGVSIKLDPGSGELLEYSTALRHPPTGKNEPRLSRRQAFAVIKLPKPAYPEDWHPVLGWYLPLNRKVAELGWRFQKDPNRGWVIVNAASGEIQERSSQGNDRIVKR